MQFYVFVQHVSRSEGLGTKLALMTEGCREVNVLDVHSQIAPGTASFATNRVRVTVKASSRIADNVLIQLLVCTCKTQGATKSSFTSGSWSWKTSCKLA